MSQIETFRYDDEIVRKFLLATIVWGVVGLLLGVIIATQLVFWETNLGPWFSFGRLRPLHTNAVIFAFVGNGMFAGIYHSMQRLCKARMFSDALSNINFWGWQLIIVAAAVTLPLGITVSKEYAELEWPIDIAITLVWVVFAINFFGTLLVRRERHIYVAIWFYMATVITVALLHIVNSLELPVTFLKSYSIYAGVQDALVQWWYGHNAVAFFLTTPILGLMYYYMPKVANRPVYSYRLSVIHFWALIFLYIWAGPHHLLYTALPDWAQTLGMVFSLMLIAPSWGGMINGLMTLRGAWEKLRTDPVLKFLVVAISFYGMSTFEGPMLSIKSVNALSHYTDWTIGHVHSGALGWNGFMNFALIYFLVPRLWKTELYSVRLATIHFWIGTIGIIFYIISMWVAGITQGLMWRAFDSEGYLAYGNFVETVLRVVPMYWVRLIGGLLYLGGIILLVYNIWKTIAGAEVPEDEQASAPALTGPKPVYAGFQMMLETQPIKFGVWVLVAVLIGGVIEFIPMFAVKSNIPTIASVQPYTPLELEGRDIYVREGCYTCHSQMIRPFRAETERYGEYSKAGEFVYDHPFQFGSRRIGPDLHRIGGKYPDIWHYRHMENPRSTSQGSIMPNYDFLLTTKLSTLDTKAKIKAMQTLGVPYSREDIENAVKDLKKQAKQIGDGLAAQGVLDSEDKEIVALIAYMQRLGTDIKKEPIASR
ncbi:MAG: cytochrome-c oxidase, cbb3-type subunit I [Deltaproteobacteria bacterium]|jgi:cytochrome c oxidase cbb3-type subunit I/II|nr:cytochrome-c oxidase, cbb3-type subunit I [SAR324 cluster bacterium]